MKITICGSMQFEQEMNEAEAKLQALGYETEKPNSVEGGPSGHFGGNTLMEITYAFAQGLDVYTLYDLPKDISYADEINAMKPIVLNGDVSKIDEYVKKLPIVCISSQSPVKHTAINRGFRKTGLAVRTVGIKVESDVSDQPQSIEETYSGALNRHQSLKLQCTDKEADFYATIESGLANLHDNHNVFGCSVIIIEKKGQEPKVGINIDIEFPKQITDKVPSVYPDIGILVQQEYGSKLKDPYPFFTNSQLTRAKILEDAVDRVVIQYDF